MAGREGLYRRDCAECGTEFVPDLTNRAARLCPLCRVRRDAHAAVRKEGGAVLRTEVRGHLWSPSKWPRPGAAEADGGGGTER